MIFRYINGFDLVVSDNLNYEIVGNFVYLQPNEDVTDLEEASITVNPIGEGVNQFNFKMYYK